MRPSMLQFGALFVALAFPLLSSATPASQGRAAGSSASDPCSKTSLMAASQAQMTACSAAGVSKSDEALNAAYQRLLAQLPDGQSRKDLRKAEKAWLGFRDAACAFEGDSVEGGSLQPMIVSQCISALTRERTHGLQTELSLFVQ